MNARKTALSIAAVCLCTLAIVGLGGCAQKAKPASTMQVSPTTNLPSGTIGGLELVSVSTLPMGSKADVDGWVAGGQTADAAPTLKQGSYKPIVTSKDLTKAAIVVGSSNGMATKDAVLTFSAAGAKKLSAATTGHAGDSLALLIGGKLVDVITFNDAITDGTLTISGSGGATDPIEKAIQPAL